MANAKTVTATIDGHTYQIPDIWIAGFCQSNGCDAEQAVRHWHNQSQLAELDEGP